MEDVIKEHEHNFSIQPDGRCKCLLNGHVFPNNPQAVASFISGRRYRQMCKGGGGVDQGKALQGYEPYLTQSRNFPDRLFCRLTCRLLKRDTRAVENYLKGRKYQHARGSNMQWELNVNKKDAELCDKGEQELMSEPDLESDEDGQHADDSEQTEQMAKCPSSSPCILMQESIQTDTPRAVNSSWSSQNVDPDTDVATRQQRLRPPRPKRRKRASAD